MSWGMGGVPKPSDRTASNNTSNNRSNKKSEPKKTEPVFKTEQMKNLEAYQAKYANRNLGQALQLLSDTEESRQNPNYRPLNLNQFLQQKGVSSDPNVPVLAFQAQSLQDVQVAKPIDLSKITSTQDLIDSQESGARGFYESQRVSNTSSGYGTNITVEQETPTSRRMGFGQGGGAANLGLGYQTITEPTSFTDYAFGRINTPIQEPIVEEPKVIEETKTIQPDYTKIALIGVGVFAVLALIIVRMKK